MFSIRGYLRQIISVVSLARQRKTATPAHFPKRKNNNFLKMAVFPTYVPIAEKYLVSRSFVL